MNRATIWQHSKSRFVKPAQSHWFFEFVERVFGVSSFPVQLADRSRSGVGAPHRADRRAWKPGSACGIQQVGEPGEDRNGVLWPQDEREIMTLKVDEKADALYLRLDDSNIIESEEVSPGVILDFNADNQVVGVEILNLSKRSPRLNLRELEFQGY
jgi:uncharacterized protein YuzE